MPVKVALLSVALAAVWKGAIVGLLPCVHRWVSKVLVHITWYHSAYGAIILLVLTLKDPSIGLVSVLVLDKHEEELRIRGHRSTVTQEFGNEIISIDDQDTFMYLNVVKLHELIWQHIWAHNKVLVLKKVFVQVLFVFGKVSLNSKVAMLIQEHLVLLAWLFYQFLKPHMSFFIFGGSDLFFLRLLRMVKLFFNSPTAVVKFYQIQDLWCVDAENKAEITYIVWFVN